MKCDFDFTFRIRYFMINLALNVYDFWFSIMEIISAGVHIFGHLQGKAVDNHFIYLEISPEQDFTTFLKELKVNNGFHERCEKFGISHLDTELSILENKERKLVVVNNNTSWKHAVKLLLKEETELHGDSFSGGRREKKGGRNEKRVGERRRLPPLNMTSCVIAI